MVNVSLFLSVAKFNNHQKNEIPASFLTLKTQWLNSEVFPAVRGVS
jgi:hypothetical protein